MLAEICVGIVVWLLRLVGSWAWGLDKRLTLLEVEARRDRRRR
jgi:hypothetical protein